MSDAANSFERGIRDADALLEMFDRFKGTPETANAEVLKRAALVIAIAAWETYLKARIREEFATWLRAVDGSSVGKFIQRKLDEDMKRFFNPNSERTKRLFIDYFEVDITKEWIWDNYDSAAATKALDTLISKRNNAAHQANTSPHPSAEPHSVKREELEKGIRFLKGLVATMEKIKIAR